MRLFLNDIIDHVLFFAQDEEDAAFRQAVQKTEVDISPVGQQHVAVL